MSPRLMSISSVVVTETAIGGNASSSSPSHATTVRTRVRWRDGRTMISAPGRRIPEASVPEKPRKLMSWRMAS
jgi:hypothetical protein